MICRGEVDSAEVKEERKVRSGELEERRLAKETTSSLEMVHSHSSGFDRKH